VTVSGNTIIPVSVVLVLKTCLIARSE